MRTTIIAFSKRHITAASPSSSLVYPRWDLGIYCCLFPFHPLTTTPVCSFPFEVQLDRVIGEDGILRNTSRISGVWDGDGWTEIGEIR